MSRVAVIFGLSWLLYAPECQAQSPTDGERCVVVVCSREMAGVVHRLAQPAIEVRFLHSALAGESNVATRNRRVVELRSATGLLHDGVSENDNWALWKERLENHGVRSVRVYSTTNRSTTEACVRQAHAALLQLFPDERLLLDERLQVELLRLRSTQGAALIVSAE